MLEFRCRSILDGVDGNSAETGGPQNPEIVVEISALPVLEHETYGLSDAALQVLV